MKLSIIVIISQKRMAVTSSDIFLNQSNEGPKLSADGLHGYEQL